MSFDPELYARLHTGNPGDVAFYVEACTGARQVVELGCGDGRVMAPVASAGHEVIGVDRHPGMLAAARRRCHGLAVRLIQAEMTAPALGGRFDRVIIPYNALYCMEDDRATVACLSAAGELLTRTGRLLFDVYRVSADLVDGAADNPDYVESITYREAKWDVYEYAVHDKAAHNFAITYIHVPADDAPPAADVANASAYTLTHHYFEFDQLSAILAAAGLEAVGTWGGFDRRPLRPTSERLVVCARAVADDR